MQDPPELPSDEPRGMGFADYWRLVRRHWAILAVAACCGGVVGYSVPQRTLTTYVSDTKLIVQAGYPVTTWDEAYSANQLTAQLASSYVELLEDRASAQAVVDDLHLEQDASAVQGMVSAEAVPDANIIVVTARSRSAAQAQRIAASYGGVFAERVDRLQAATPRGSPVVSVDTAESASAPRMPTSPDPVRAGVYGAALAVLVLLGVLAVRSRGTATVRDVGDLATRARLRTATRLDESGAVASQPVPRPEQLPAFYDQVRLVRRAVLLGRRRPLRSLLVVSPSPRDGRTTVACALAEVLAEAGARVVLVDGDLRRPGVLGALRPLTSQPAPDDLGPGLVEVLAGDAPLEEALRAAPGRPYDVLSGRRVPGGVPEGVGPADLAQLLAGLEASYDVVVVDSPPLLHGEVSERLAEVVDGALLVVRHGWTSVEALDAAADRLSEIGVPVLGAVLSRSPRPSAVWQLLRRTGASPRPPVHLRPRVGEAAG